MFSESGEMDIKRVGYNSERILIPHISLLYPFAKDKGEPAYYGKRPEYFLDVSVFDISIKGSGINNAVIVAVSFLLSDHKLKFFNATNNKICASSFKFFPVSITKQHTY